jgi:hypothetical protein
MNPMSPERITEALSGPHQAVLGVSREHKGPHSVPMSYLYDGEQFFMVTSTETLLGRLLAKKGRATVTVQHERVVGRSVHQWYVIAEGPASFTDVDPSPIIRQVLIKDRGEQHVDEWISRISSVGEKVVTVVPDRMSGYESLATLD